jgi:hypothetical protein
MEDHTKLSTLARKFHLLDVFALASMSGPGKGRISNDTSRQIEIRMEEYIENRCKRAVIQCNRVSLRKSRLANDERGLVVVLDSGECRIRIHMPAIYFKKVIYRIPETTRRLYSANVPLQGLLSPSPEVWLHPMQEERAGLLTAGLLTGTDGKNQRTAVSNP